MSNDRLPIRIRLKGELGEVEMEVPRIYTTYPTGYSNKDDKFLINEAIRLYKGLDKAND